MTRRCATPPVFADLPLLTDNGEARLFNGLDAAGTTLSPGWFGAAPGVDLHSEAGSRSRSATAIPRLPRSREHPRYGYTLHRRCYAPSGTSFRPTPSWSDARSSSFYHQTRRAGRFRRSTPARYSWREWTSRSGEKPLHFQRDLRQAPCISFFFGNADPDDNRYPLRGPRLTPRQIRVTPLAIEPGGRRVLRRQEIRRRGLEILGRR